MAYIGAVAPGYDPTRASVPQLDAERFNGDASTTAFTLTRQVASPTDINVIVENVLQEPIVSYSVSGYTLTFTEAPGTGTNNIYVIYRASAISSYAFVPDGSITYAKLANNIRQFTVDTVTANGTGSTVELTETPASANSLIVSVDGVIQTAPTNYTLSGSTITFTGVPDNGANVVVKHIGFRTTSTVTALQAGSVTATEIADGSVTNAKIVSVANTKITGLVTASQIATVANTQITGNITATNIAGGSNGTIPYQSANGTTQMLSVGTSGQVLQSNGASAPIWTTLSSGLSLISTQSGSGANNVTWSGLSGSTNYLLVLSGLADTTANRDTRIRIGTGGTILTSGYVYSGHIYGAGGPAAYGGTGAGLILSLDGSYLRYFYGFIYITQPPDYSAVNFNGATNDNTSASFGNTITGAIPTSAIISDIRIYSPNNFNFGSAALYKMSV